jgi:hypothetical protein
VGPNLNAFAERWVRSVKEECLSHLILFGERSLRKALIQFQEHYHQERNHQGKSNVLLFPAPLLGLSPVGDVASAVENVSAAYSDTTVAPHEYFDQTRSLLPTSVCGNSLFRPTEFRDHQLEGPEWLSLERYNLAAKYPAGLPANPAARRPAVNLMMQKMLADVFKLALHRSHKDFPVCGLVVSKGGIKFRESATAPLFADVV